MITFQFYSLFLCVWVFACTSVCESWASLVSLEARRRHQIFCNWNHRFEPPCWCWELKQITWKSKLSSRWAISLAHWVLFSLLIFPNLFIRKNIFWMQGLSWHLFCLVQCVFPVQFTGGRFPIAWKPETLLHLLLVYYLILDRSLDVLRS